MSRQTRTGDGDKLQEDAVRVLVHGRRRRIVPLHNFERLMDKQPELKARMGSVCQDYSAHDDREDQGGGERQEGHDGTSTGVPEQPTAIRRRRPGARSQSAGGLLLIPTMLTKHRITPVHRIPPRSPPASSLHFLPYLHLVLMLASLRKVGTVARVRLSAHPATSALTRRGSTGRVCGSEALPLHPRVPVR